MKKKTLLALGLTAAAALGAVTAQGTSFITIGSGATTGVYFPVATGFARLMNDANVGLRANARSTGGSVFNVNALNTDELQMAIAQNDIVFYAYRGQGLEAFQGRPNTNIRSMATLYPEIVHVIARRDANIRSINDLRGKRVVIGDVGSGTEQNAAQILSVFGLGFNDLGQAIRVNATQGIQLMQDRRADALFYTVGLGASAIQQAALTTPINIVPIGGNQATQLRQRFPFYVQVNIPANSYRGQGATVPSVAVAAMLITTADVPEQTVYNAMRAVFGNEQALRAIHPNLANFFSFASAVRGLPAPLHPGAARFYRERGINVR